MIPVSPPLTHTLPLLAKVPPISPSFLPLLCLDFFYLLPSACPVGLPFLLTLWYFESFEPSPRNLFWPFFTNERFQPYVKVAQLFKTFNQLRWPNFFLNVGQASDDFEIKATLSIIS